MPPKKRTTNKGKANTRSNKSSAQKSNRKSAKNIGKIRPGKAYTAKKPSKKKKRKKIKKQSSWKWRFFKWLLKYSIAGLAILFILVFFVVAIYAHDLPDIDKLYEDQLKPSITILDSNGDLITTYGDVFTENVDVKDMPDHLIDAVIATEDRRFYSHYGLDPVGLARAMYTNFRKGYVVQGGSTITQQLAKIVFLKPERNFKRKVQEAVLAFWLERKFTKDQILTMYLNRVYLGAGVYGVDAASRKYFKKSVRNINLYESAMLAGLLKAPSTYSPQNNPRAAAKRTHQVLVNMVNADLLAERKKERALAVGTEINKSTFRNTSRYFTDYVVDQVQHFIGKVDGSIVVTTTFNVGLQKIAEDSVTKTMLEFGDQLNFKQAALVTMRPDGAIVSMLGGVDYAESQFNRAFQAQRQPGSLFKMLVYMAALEQGMTPNDYIDDVKTTHKANRKNYTPRNYDGKYHGIVTLREALTKSYNAAAVNLSERVGRQNVIKLAQRLGIKSPLTNTPSIALGASEVNLLEMTTAFAHLANNGHTVIPHVIEEIRSKKGEILYQRQGDYNFRVLGLNATKMMNDMLVSVVNDGTGRGASIGRDVAGKTGTTQNYRDAWFIGYTPQYVTGVWVGNDRNEPMDKVTGGSMPARIWREFMRPALAETPQANIDVNPYPEIQGNPWQRENFWDRLVGD